MRPRRAAVGQKVLVTHPAPSGSTPRCQGGEKLAMLLRPGPSTDLLAFRTQGIYPGSPAPASDGGAGDRP